MTAAELITEGERLAKPCVYLRDRGAGAPCAIWGGPLPLPQPGPKLQHVITLDCEALPEHFTGAAGSASLYSNHLEDASVRFGPKLSVARPTRLARAQQWLTRARSATPLYAQPGVSLPPIEAVFRFGSPRFQAWGAEIGWDPEWGQSADPAFRELERAYDQAYQASCPIYRRDAHAVVGGWHMPWPDGDWQACAADTLVLWTLAEAEPWIEVWRTADGFRVIHRIT